jgi:hypothetical protein
MERLLSLYYIVEFSTDRESLIQRIVHDQTPSAHHQLKAHTTAHTSQHRTLRTFCEPKLISVRLMESSAGRVTLVLSAALLTNNVGWERSYTCTRSWLWASFLRMWWPSMSIRLSLRRFLSEASLNAAGTGISGALLCKSMDELPKMSFSPGTDLKHSVQTAYEWGITYST